MHTHTNTLCMHTPHTHTHTHTFYMHTCRYTMHETHARTSIHTCMTMPTHTHTRTHTHTLHAPTRTFHYLWLGKYRQTWSISLAIMISILRLVLLPLPPDAGEHDKEAQSHPCRVQRRGQRCAGRRRLRHVVWRDGQGELPPWGCAHHAPRTLEGDDEKVFCVCERVCVCVCARVCVCAHVCVCADACMHMGVSVCVSVSLHFYACVCVYLSVFVCAVLCVWAHMCVWVRGWMCMCVCCCCYSCISVRLSLPPPPPFTPSSSSPLAHCFSCHLQICREAESAIFHNQQFEELRRETPVYTDPTHTIAIAAVEASFTCMAAAIIVITTSGRSVHPQRSHQPCFTVVWCPCIRMHTHACMHTYTHAHAHQQYSVFFFQGVGGGGGSLMLLIHSVAFHFNSVYSRLQWFSICLWLCVSSLMMLPVHSVMWHFTWTLHIAGCTGEISVFWAVCELANACPQFHLNSNCVWLALSGQHTWWQPTARAAPSWPSPGTPRLLASATSTVASSPSTTSVSVLPLRLPLLPPCLLVVPENWCLNSCVYDFDSLEGSDVHSFALLCCLRIDVWILVCDVNTLEGSDVRSFTLLLSCGAWELMSEFLHVWCRQSGRFWCPFFRHLVFLRLRIDVFLHVNCQHMRLWCSSF